MIPFGVFPHSEICGSKLICSSPQLIAACHVLLRLLMPRHSPCALVRLNFLTDFYSACSLELLSFLKQISFAAKKHLSSFLRSTFRWNCNFTHFLGKTKLISQFCPLKSVRFLLILSKFLWIILYSYSIVKVHHTSDFSSVLWSVWMDSNHRPRAYQARALTTWATDRYSRGSRSLSILLFASVASPSFRCGNRTLYMNKFMCLISRNYRL